MEENLDTLSKKPVNKFIKYSLLCLFSIIFTLVLIESMLRLYYFLGEKQLFGLKPHKITLTWIEDSDIGKVIIKPNSDGWMVTPSIEYYNYIHSNSDGFYDDTHQIAKPENTYRILFLGDSFVASLQTPLEQTFFKQVEKTFNQKSQGKKIEVLALGMGDTGQAQQYIALKKIGLKYKPDLVVSMLLTTNDLKNNSPTLQGDPYRPYFVLDGADLKLLPHPKYSEREGAIFKNWFKDLRVVELALQFRQRYKDFISNGVADFPIDYHVYDTNYNKDFADSLKVTEKLILEEKKSVEESGGKFVFVTLANNEQVNSYVWEELKKTYPNMAKANLDLQKPDKELASFCKQENLDCLQMLPTFLDYIKANPQPPTHFHYDGHWNQLGTDIAAKFLIDNLQSNIPLKNSNP